MHISSIHQEAKGLRRKKVGAERGLWTSKKQQKWRGGGKLRKEADMVYVGRYWNRSQKTHILALCWSGGNLIKLPHVREPPFLHWVLIKLTSLDQLWRRNETTDMKILCKSYSCNENIRMRRDEKLEKRREERRWFVKDKSPASSSFIKNNPENIWVSLFKKKRKKPSMHTLWLCIRGVIHLLLLQAGHQPAWRLGKPPTNSGLCSLKSEKCPIFPPLFQKNSMENSEQEVLNLRQIFF